MSEENIIPITELENDFDYFLKIENNKRVFFSGRFGVGKTYFLKDFFNLHLDNYEVFHLFPTNYQISSNGDIIELLKYDILVELMKKNGELFQENNINGVKDSTLLFYSWYQENFSLNKTLQASLSVGDGVLNILQDPILSLFGKLGKPLKDLLVIDEKFQEFKKEYISGEKGLAEKYLKEIKSKNISETDFISHLVSKKITELKQSKKSILILDDLDRIDPEHIFRILNVFSAHFNDEVNKFGFDAIIIVGDVQNIRSIFYHKYGRGADFEGYFDKFFSVKPYNFDNKKAVSEKIPYLVKLIKSEEPELKAAIGESGYIKLFLSDLLNKSLILGRLNLRQLYKPINYSFIELKKGIYTKDSFRDNFQQILDIGIKLAIAILGGNKEFFIEIIKEIKANIDILKSEAHAPYNAYSNSMIKKLMKAKTNEITDWHGYSFNLSQEGNFTRLNVDGGTEKEMALFYELLIDYVSKSKYEKNSKWDYEI